jgi:hypothetical protein
MGWRFGVDFKVFLSTLNWIRAKRIVILNSLRHCVFLFYNSEPVCNARYPTLNSRVKVSISGL